MIRILFVGDVVGSSGMKAFEQYIPALKKHTACDFIVVNGENADNGIGITPALCKQLFNSGADCITLGNHAFRKTALLEYIAQDPRVIRPLNFGSLALGKGFFILSLEKNGTPITCVVVNIMGQSYMEPVLNNPFQTMTDFLTTLSIGKNTNAIIVDMHAEASSEKMGMGFMFDGKVSAVVGTHTHIPTADARILPKGTGYRTDCGMCGDYNSIIGTDMHAPLWRMAHKIPSTVHSKFFPATGPATLCATIIDINAQGLCAKMQTCAVGGALGISLEQALASLA